VRCVAIEAVSLHALRSPQNEGGLEERVTAQIAGRLEPFDKLSKREVAVPQTFQNALPRLGQQGAESRPALEVGSQDNHVHEVTDQAGEFGSASARHGRTDQEIGLAGQAVQFEVSVKAVDMPVLPELNADFAIALGIKDGDLQKMRAEVQSNLLREVKKRLLARIKNQVMDVLLAVNPVEVPKTLVDMEARQMADAARRDLDPGLEGIRRERGRLRARARSPLDRRAGPRIPGALLGLGPAAERPLSAGAPHGNAGMAR
jgi:hypothetical protein